jgi:hypothetical protein
MARKISAFSVATAYLPFDCGFPLGLIESIDTGTVIDLLGPTLIALLIYMFVCVQVELHLSVEGVYLSISVEH